MFNFNRTGVDYLINTTTPKLLLCCGHLCCHDYDKYYSNGKELGELSIHKHQGWYTIDKDSERHPDMVADLENHETLEYLSTIFHQCLTVIYVEGWSFHSVAFHKMAYQVLKEDGVLVYSLGMNTSSGHLMELHETLSLCGFNLNKVKFFHNSIAEVSHSILRQVLIQFPHLVEINNYDIFRGLIDNSPEELKFYIKVEYHLGDIPKLLDYLKELSKIDPFLGWGLSFDHHQYTYVIIKK